MIFPLSVVLCVFHLFVYYFMQMWVCCAVCCLLHTTAALGRCFAAKTHNNKNALLARFVFLCLFCFAGILLSLLHWVYVNGCFCLRLWAVFFCFHLMSPCFWAVTGGCFWNWFFTLKNSSFPEVMHLHTKNERKQDVHTRLCLRRWSYTTIKGMGEVPSYHKTMLTLRAGVVAAVWGGGKGNSIVLLSQTHTQWLCYVWASHLIACFAVFIALFFHLKFSSFVFRFPGFALYERLLQNLRFSFTCFFPVSFSYIFYSQL